MIFMSEAIIGRVATMSATVLFGRVRLIVILSAMALMLPAAASAGYGENDLIVKFKPGISQRRARTALVSRNVSVRGGVGMERVLVVEHQPLRAA